MDENQARLAAVVCLACMAGAWIGLLAVVAHRGAVVLQQLADSGKQEIAKSGQHYRDTVTLSRYQAELGEGS